MDLTFTPGLVSDIPVLVVCRDTIVRTGIAATLGSARGLAVQAADPAPAVGCDTTLRALVGRAEVVVGDYESALACARALRRSWPTHAPSGPKVLVVSHRHAEADVRRALEAGVQGYLPLDCETSELVESVIALHRGQRALGRMVAQRMAESFDHEGLTDRELEVLRLVVAGDANKSIAKKLDIAVGTVKVHVRSIMGKLGARTRTEAASAALRRGLVEMDGEVPPSAPHPVVAPMPDARAGSLAARTGYGGLRVVAGG